MTDTASQPSIDPWKGFRGVCSGTLVLEAIVMLLVLTVIGRVDDGVHLVAWKVIYVLAVAVGMIAACAFQSKPYAMPLNLGLAVAAVVGFVVHPSMGIAGIFFLLVWVYLLYLRSSLRKRIAGGYLPSQHM